MKIKSILFFCFFINVLQGQIPIFTKTEIQADLAFLKQQLIEKHPNLYMYSSRKEVDVFFENLHQNLPENITNLEAYKIIASTSNIIKDGHSYVYPSAKHLDNFYNNAPLFPLEVFWHDDNLHIINNLSRENNIPIGSKIISINDILVTDIRATITKNTVRDGDNMAYANYIFHEFFPAYYSFFYGFQPEFKIEFKTDKNEIQTLIIKGVTRADLKEIRSSRSPQPITNLGIYSTIRYSDSIFILTIPSFSNDILKNDYQQKFKQEINFAFEKLAAEKSPHLVIDLRGNQGGELSNGVFLLQQIMTAPFQCVQAYHKIKYDKSTGERSLKRLNNKWNKTFQPTKNAYKGKVYLFIDGGSYSCSSIVAQTFQSNNRGKILGEVSGGSAFTNTGAPNEVIELPNSKIQFTIPKTQYILQENQSTSKTGVVPNYTIPHSIQSFIHRKDFWNDQDSYYIFLLEEILK